MQSFKKLSNIFFSGLRLSKKIPYRITFILLYFIQIFKNLCTSVHFYTFYGYDEGKRIAETLLYDFNRFYNLDVRCVRIFNTYGPHMAENDGRVVSNFITQAISNQDITIYGDGSQSRSFCYISDLITGLVLIMNQNHRTLPVNCGNPCEITVKELAYLIVKMVGSSSNIIYKQLPENDPRIRKPNIDILQSITGWKPEVELDEGLRKTILYFMQSF